jgi:signal transduction histidine kinase
VVFRSLLERRPSIFELFLLDEAGNPLAARRRVGRPGPVSHRGPIAPREGRPGAGPLHAGAVYFEQRLDFQGNAFEAPFLDFLLDVRGGAAPSAAVLLVRVDLTSLWEAVAALEVGETGYVYVVDSAGRLLAHRDQRLLRQSVEALVGRSPEALAQPRLSVYRGLAGKLVVSAGRPLVLEPAAAPRSRGEWLVVVEQPLLEAVGPLAPQGVAWLLAFGILTSLIWSIIQFARRQIVAPLLDLREGVDHWRQGDPEYRVQLDRDDELGALAEAFNTLAARLARTIETLSSRVAALKRAEEALLEAQSTLEARVRERTAELRDLNEELRSLVQIVTHDLRAPLVNLEGFTGELEGAFRSVNRVLAAYGGAFEGGDRRLLDSALEADIPEALVFIQSSTARMDFLINSLLKLSQMGRRELFFERVDLESLTIELVKTLRFQIEQRGAEVIVESLPALVADRTALEQIMGNLLTNAVLYLEPGRLGTIRVRGARNDGSAVVVEVEDTGRGIAEEDLKKIFQPFRRSGVSEVPGEGMGLTYVQALVRRHGGSIECRSQLGEGSTFRFSLRGDLQEGETESVMRAVI